MDDIKVKVIKECLYAMKTKGILIAKLSELSGLSAPTVIKIINKGEGKMENIQKILDILEIKI